MLSEFCSITFGETSLFLNTDPETPLHLEEDLAISGNILYCDSYTIKSTNGRQIITVAEENIGEVRGFVQLNSSFILVMDIQEHCLKIVTRASKRVVQFAGKCGEKGHTDGQLLSARFHSPLRGIHAPYGSQSYHRKIYINCDCSGRSGRIRILHLNYRLVTHLVEFYNLSRSGDMTWDTSYARHIVITGTASVYRTELTSDGLTGPLRTITGNEEDTVQFRDGAFRTARFYYPIGIVSVAQDIYLVADSRNHRLRVMNTYMHTVHTICTGVVGMRSIFGAINVCQLKRPTDLLVVDNNRTVYISMLNAIVKLEGIIIY